MLDNWQRIEQVIKWVGAASVSAFAREIGLNRGENLYQIKRGNNGISKDLADTITVKYPSISKAWLLTGEGDMIPGSGLKRRYDIPFFKSDVVELVSNGGDSVIAEIENKSTNGNRGDDLTPDCYVSFPMLEGCGFAGYTFSDAMSPVIPRGATLFLQKACPAAVIPGNIYLVVGRNFCGVRYLRKGNKEGQVKLIPANSSDYDEVVIQQEDIITIFQVKSVLVNNF